MPTVTRLPPPADIGPRRLPGATAWTLVALLVVALNLRLAITAVSPVVDGVREAMELSRQTAGLLTTLPVLCFGVLAPAAAYAARRFGNENVVAAASCGLVLAILVRSAGGAGWLFAGTLLLGAAATAGNVLVPALVKQHLADIAGPAMALYSASLTAGAAVAAWGTALLYDASRSWQWSLAAGAVPALVSAIAFGAWTAAHRGGRSEPGVLSTPEPAAGRVWRSPLAWQLAVFFGAQALLFFSFLAWLPVLLQDRGVSLATSGVMLSVYSVLGVAGALVVPPLAVRRPDQRALVAGVALGWLVGILGLLLVPDAYLVWSVLLGIVQGAGISLAMTLIVLRAGDAATARDLSGMVQLAGYLLAALGPLLLGALRDHLGGWDPALLLLLVVAVVMLGSGWGAGSRRMVR